MKIKLDKWAFKPVRCHSTDAGIDLMATSSGIVRAHGSATFGTGVHVEVPHGTAGILLPKSGLMVKHDILTFGVVDCGYSGEVMVRVFNLGDEPYFIHAGDKITQLIIADVRYEPVEIVDEINEGERGERGFGSTGA